MNSTRDEVVSSPHKTFQRKPFPYKYNDYPSLRLREKLYHPSVFTTRALLMNRTKLQNKFLFIPSYFNVDTKKRSN